MRADEVDEAVSSISSTPTEVPEVFAPTVPGVDAVDPQLCKELRARVADILGPPGQCHAPEKSEQAEAALTVERFGGERSCFSRFLRARGLDVLRAEEMLRATMSFRSQHGVNHILKEPKAMAVWQSYRRSWPMSVPVFTSDGSIVVYFRFAHFYSLCQQGATEECLRTLYLCMLERCLRLQHQGRRRRGQGPGDELPPVYEVYDMYGVGFEHFRCVFGLRMLPRVLSIGQAHYPENLRTAIVLSAPFGFGAAWNAVRKVLHERTQAKIHITGTTGEDLLASVLGLSSEKVTEIFASVTPYSRGSPGSDGVVMRSDLMDGLEL